MDDDYEVRFILEGGKYRMYELRKDMIINNGNIFIKNKSIESDFGEPIIQPGKTHMTIQEATKYLIKKHLGK